MQLLVEDMSSLMRSVALHNAPLLHQHSCRRMDSGAVAVRDQVPPPGFYKSILVRRSPSASQSHGRNNYMGFWRCAHAERAPCSQSHPTQAS